MSPINSNSVRAEIDAKYSCPKPYLRLIHPETEENRTSGELILLKEEQKPAHEHEIGFRERQPEMPPQQHPPTANVTNLDKDTQALLPSSALKTKREILIERIQQMPEAEIPVMSVFADAVEGKNLEFREPEDVTYLRDDPEFRAFVAENQWSDRTNKDWLQKTDVFEFVEKTYARYLGAGLARSCWVGLDDLLADRITKRAYANRKSGLYRSTDGIPPNLNLPLKENGKSSNPDTLMMKAMENIFLEVSKVKTRSYREINKLSPNPS